MKSNTILVPGVDTPTESDVAIALAAARGVARSERAATLYTIEALRLSFPDEKLPRLAEMVGYADDTRRRIWSKIRNFKENGAWSDDHLNVVLTAVARQEALTA